jgi:hypothetical protein
VYPTRQSICSTDPLCRLQNPIVQRELVGPVLQYRLAPRLSAGPCCIQIPAEYAVPTTARLVSSDPSIFPPQGTIQYGDTVLAPDTSEIQVLLQPTNCGSHTPADNHKYPHITAIAAVSDTIRKTQRSAKNGTRVLKEEVTDLTYLALVSATPIEAGNKMFHHTLYHLLQN